MTCPALHLSPQLLTELWAHLLPRDSWREQAAFLFCDIAEDAQGFIFAAREARLLEPSDFAAQYNDYIELTDRCRVEIIKRAHALGAALAEFHSHPGPRPAAFSFSDRAGLRETVPHMSWRLAGRPYLAVVVAHGSFDALLWPSGAQEPIQLAAIKVGEEVLRPTNLSLEIWHDDYREPL